MGIYINGSKTLEFNCHLLDEKKFFSPRFQLVYQYLDKYAQHGDLDSFHFNVEHVDKDKHKCLQTALR